MRVKATEDSEYKFAKCETDTIFRNEKRKSALFGSGKRGIKC